MKKFFTLMLLLVCSISLLGCSNMSNQDVGTITGGVAGGLIGSTIGGGSGRLLAIGAGTIAGALIGSSIGKSMDQQDYMRMDQALNDNSIGQPTYWRNAHSNTSYQVVPTRNVVVHGNRYCREYRTTAIINGQKQHMYGTACRRRDGSWHVVN